MQVFCEGKLIVGQEFDHTEVFFKMVLVAGYGVIG